MHSKYDHQDPELLWVSSSAAPGGNGTFDTPFDELERALTIVKPGNTIVLKNGVYSHDATFDISGLIHQPIGIVAEHEGKAEVQGACWFFYDASDLIVSGINFKEAPFGAISVIGACMRNRFDNLRFIDCGTRDAASCTFFFGGAGGNCNVVESCRFERPALRATVAAETAIIALMIGEGEGSQGAPLTDHILRKNRFVNYDYGILIGAGDSSAGECGHIVEYNTLEEIGREGILVKCGDTIVRGNLLLRSRNNSIDIGAGRGSIVEANRILDCAKGIMVNGPDHTVAGNCIVRCRGQAILVCGASSAPQREAASNLIIEQNTCIDCGDGEQRIAGIRIDKGTSCVVRRNLFSGKGLPYVSAVPPASPNHAQSFRGRSGSGIVMVLDNIASDRSEAMDGVLLAEVAFKSRTGDDFSNDSGYGASGWMCAPEGFNQVREPAEEAVGYRDMSFADLEEDEDETVEPAESVKSAKSKGITEEDFDSYMRRFYSREEFYTGDES